MQNINATYNRSAFQPWAAPSFLRCPNYGFDILLNLRSHPFVCFQFLIKNLGGFFLSVAVIVVVAVVVAQVAELCGVGLLHCSARDKETKGLSKNLQPEYDGQTLNVLQLKLKKKLEMAPRFEICLAKKILFMHSNYVFLLVFVGKTLFIQSIRFMHDNRSAVENKRLGKFKNMNQKDEKMSLW